MNSAYAAGAARYAAAAMFALAAPAGAQQNYPVKPIRIISPYPPGGTTDILARMLGPKLTESWGQQVIVDNRPGGNTIIGYATAKFAAELFIVCIPLIAKQAHAEEKAAFEAPDVEHFLVRSFDELLGGFFGLR